MQWSFWEKLDLVVLIHSAESCITIFHILYQNSSHLKEIPQYDYSDR